MYLYVELSCHPFSGVVVVVVTFVVLVFRVKTLGHPALDGGGVLSCCGPRLEPRPGAELGVVSGFT